LVWGVIIPVLPTLISRLTGQDLSHAALYSGLLLPTYALMQFLFSPVIGGLSDRYGRRPVLLFSLLGFGLDYIFQAFAPTIGWLFLGRALAGITGASFTTASAYIVDISTPEKRAQNFGLLYSAFGLGFIIGPFIGSIAVDWGFRAPFLVAGGLSLLNFLFGLFILPESLKKENRRNFDWKRANPLGSLMHLRKYPLVSGLVISIVLINLASHAVQSNWGFYNMFRFKWSEKMVGYSLAVVGALTVVVQAGLIRVITPKLGVKRSVYVGFACYGIGMLLFGLAGQGWMMFMILAIYCFGGIGMPALQGVISGQVPANAQGELQGALTSLMSLTSIFGPMIMNNLFYFFSRADSPVYLPGAPFFAAALMMVAALLSAMYFMKHRLPSDTAAKQNIDVMPAGH
jgi:DHA1 family tetracycline resistance protein-like MFS transporter